MREADLDGHFTQSEASPDSEARDDSLDSKAQDEDDEEQLAEEAARREAGCRSQGSVR